MRLAYANGGTPVEWPSGLPAIELDLEIAADGRAWLPVSVDDNPPVPFLLQAAAGAIALTGARPAGFGPVGAGSLTLRGELLPGIRGGLLIKQRRLALGALELGNQSLLLVAPDDWPHGMPRGGAAGVLGHDLFRRFVVRLDAGGGRLALYRHGRFDVGGMATVRRLVVLDRVPYFEVSAVSGAAPARWLRLQFEPAAATGVCLDEGARGGVVNLAGHAVALEAAPCPPGVSPAKAGARDGVFGAAALRQFVVAVDYEGGRIGFQAHE